MQGLYLKHVHRDPVPTTEQLAGQVALLNNQHRANFYIAQADAAIVVALERAGRSADPPLPLPGAAGKVIDGLYAARIAMGGLLALDDGFWTCLGAPPGEMTALLSALASPALGAFLRPRPKKRRGAPRKNWHQYAATYATAIADVLVAAGHPNPSVEQPNGPVAKIGAGFIKLVLDLPVTPASFARAVHDERKRAARKGKRTPPN